MYARAAFAWRLHLHKVKSASVNAAQPLQYPQYIPTNYLRCFIYKLPSLYPVSCSKDIRKLNSRGHIFQLPLTRAPFQCLQHFRINNLVFLFTCSQAMLTWLLRNLIMPANQGLRCPTDSPGKRRVPTRKLCQPRRMWPAWPLSQLCCPAMGTVSSYCAGGRRSQRAIKACAGSLCSSAPWLPSSPLEKTQFPSM